MLLFPGQRRPSVGTGSAGRESWWSRRVLAPGPPANVPLLLEFRGDSGGKVIIEIDHGPAILWFANARAGWHQRLREISAGDGDVAGIHAETNHLGFDRHRAPLGKSL